MQMDYFFKRYRSILNAVIFAVCLISDMPLYLCPGNVATRAVTIVTSHLACIKWTRIISKRSNQGREAGVYSSPSDFAWSQWDLLVTTRSALNCSVDNDRLSARRLTTLLCSSNSYQRKFQILSYLFISCITQHHYRFLHLHDHFHITAKLP